MKPSSHKKILFASTPADGHFYPLTGLAKYLQAIGYDVRWYASVSYAGKLQQLGIPHFQFKKAVDVNAADLDLIFPERKKISNPVRKLCWDMIHYHIMRAPEYLADIAEIQKEFSFSLIIADQSFTGLPLVKEILQVPVISVGVLPLGETSKDLPPNGFGMVPAGSWLGRIRQSILRFTTTHFLFSRPNQMMQAILEKLGIELADDFIFDLLGRSADLYLQTGTPGFEYYRSDLGKNIRFIGSLLPFANHTSSEPWFDERLNRFNKVILVTLGTVEKEPGKLLVPTLEAFKGTDTLVVCTTGGSQTAWLKENYPHDNIIIRDFIPFNDVMPYADVFISNGGFGGVMSAIENELPMVVAGLYEGRNEIAARVGYFRYGINLNTESPCKTSIYNAVQELIADKKYKACISELAVQFSKYNANELCARYVADLLQGQVPGQSRRAWDWEAVY